MNMYYSYKREWIEMILIIGGRSTRFLVNPYGRKRARSNVCAGQPGLRTELTRLELEIASLACKTQALTHKLGELYAGYRCKDRQDIGAADTQADMLALSREADDCINKLYTLEKRRGVLLGRVNV
jgi:hypothetical protein